MLRRFPARLLSWKTPPGGGGKARAGAKSAAPAPAPSSSAAATQSSATQVSTSFRTLVMVGGAGLGAGLGAFALQRFLSSSWDLEQVPLLQRLARGEAWRLLVIPLGNPVDAGTALFSSAVFGATLALLSGPARRHNCITGFGQVFGVWLAGGWAYAAATWATTENRTMSIGGFQGGIVSVAALLCASLPYSPIAWGAMGVQTYFSLFFPIQDHIVGKKFIAKVHETTTDPVTGQVLSDTVKEEVNLSKGKGLRAILIPPAVSMAIGLSLGFLSARRSTVPAVVRHLL
jgi:hypothetical protein